MEFSLTEQLFRIGQQPVTLGMLLLGAGSLFVLLVVYQVGIRRLLVRLVGYLEKEEKSRKRLLRVFRNVFLLVVIILVVVFSPLNLVLYATPKVTVSVSMIFESLLIIQFAWLFDWLLSRFIIRNYYQNREKAAPERGTTRNTSAQNPEHTASRLIQYIVYAIAILLILNYFQLDITILSFPGKEQTFDFKLSNVFAAILVLLVARLLIWVLVQLVLFGYYRKREINVGSQYAINQLLTYVIYIIAVLLALDSLGIKMTVVWGGAAALLVGVGLGLQQTFDDLISGVIILFERTVEVGDIVQVEGLLGKVSAIGLRTSVLQTQSNSTVLVPNSKLISENIINFSHQDAKTRYFISVGVAYGSDTELVKNLLLQAAEEHPQVLKHPKPLIRFTEFGNSSLNFELHFWTLDNFTIDNLRSDLRFIVDRIFREHNISIPFPQQDVWFRNPMPYAPPPPAPGPDLGQGHSPIQPFHE